MVSEKNSKPAAQKMIKKTFRQRCEEGKDSDNKETTSKLEIYGPALMLIDLSEIRSNIGVDYYRTTH
jgi:hypothetical protein